MSDEVLNNEQSGLDLFDYWDIIKKYFKELLWKSWIIALIVCGVGYYFYKNEKNKPTTYSASLSFMLNNTSATPQSIEQSLGLTTSNTNIDKLMELVKSRRLVQRTLLKKAKIDGVDDYLGNHFIELLDYRETIWANNEKLKNYRFTTDTISPLNKLDNTVINLLYAESVKKGLSHVVSPSQIVTLKYSGLTEEFTLRFLILHYNAVVEYFIETSVEKQNLQYLDLVKETEILTKEVAEAEKEYSNSFDANQLGERMKSIVAQEKRNKDLEFLYTNYYELVTHRNVNKKILETMRPIVQTLEVPVLPLSVTSSNPLSALKMGGIIGFVLGVLIVIIRKIGWDFFKQERAKALRKRAAKRTALAQNS
jgi:hypothetical protein